jgi:3-oxoacyl-[acyl-carrier protein] reductase
LTMTSLDLSDRVALVGGASSGLGLATATALASRGAAVALCARRIEMVEAEAARLGRAVGVAMDLRDRTSVAAAVDQVRQRLGPIDILVLNGGGPPPADAATVDLAAARDAAELLLFGPLELLAQTLPAMRERGWGRVIGIGSSSIQQPIPGLATSSMFRAALAAHLKLLAAEIAADGVTVNMVLPGRIRTDRIVALDTAAAKRSGQTLSAVQAASQSTIPAGRYGTPEDLAAMVAFLAGADAGYLTGEQIRVDGGLIRAL